MRSATPVGPVVIWMTLVAVAGAAGPELKDELPRIPPTPPAESLKTFKVEPGLKVELVAAEPAVTDPVDVAWDEQGRLYVCELWNYPGEPGPGEPLGRVRLLESTKRDGVYDKSTIFAENLKWPGGVTCWDGGVFVASSPDVWYLKDTDGDGKADVREKVFTGFSGKTYEVANSLRWGLDNRIYISGSYAGGTVARVGPDGKPAGPGMRSRDFRFDPRTRDIEPVSGGGEWGQTFDDFGERFTCDATHMAWHSVLPRDGLARNPHLAVPAVQEMSIPEWTVLFPVSPPEPWKATRQKFWSRWVDTNGDMRAGRFPKTELAPHGFATSAAGITVYRGSALPERYRGCAFVGEPANNVVVRLELRHEGPSVKARRPERDEKEKREFLASTDNWFRPVNFANGPDGCLTVVAMYREIIEDETAIPNDILKHYDLQTGRDRGRILRVAPEGFRAPATPDLAGASTAELVKLLAHADGWWRDTAQRMLYQRQDKAAVEPLRKLVRDAANPQGRVHALWALHGIGALDGESVAAAMSDTDPRVRSHAIRLSHDHAREPAVAKKLVALADDPDPAVRFRTAFALGAVGDESAVPALANIARRDAADPWARAAILAAVPERSGVLMKQLSDDREFLKLAESRELLAALALVSGTRNESGEVAGVLSTISGPSLAGQGDTRRAMLRQLADGLSRAGASLGDYLGKQDATNERLAADLSSFFDEACKTAANAKAKERERAEAIGLLTHAPWALAGDTLPRLLDPGQPKAVQLAAVRALGTRKEGEVASTLLGKWPSLGPAVRPAVIDALFRRPDSLAVILDAIEQKKLLPTELEPARQQALRSSDDPAIRGRAEKLLPATPASADKRELINRYRDQVSKLTGDPARGRTVFANSCAACHTPDRGPRVGANLATLEDRSPDKLLSSILDPNADVKPAFVNYVIRTRDGQDLSGVVAAETATSVTLRQGAGVEEVVSRATIKSMRSTGLSLMPEGLESGIDYQQMADLLRFLQEFKE